MITARNDTEDRLLDGLHRNIDGYRSASALYDRRVTRHVHDALRRWEDAGLVRRSPYDRWSHDPCWQVHPDHIDRARRRRLLCEEAGALLQRRINAQKDVTKYTEVVVTGKPELADLISTWEQTGEGIDKVEVTSRGIAFAATRISQRKRGLAHIDGEIDALRERAKSEGFDPDAIMAGRADDQPVHGDPLGEGA